MRYLIYARVSPKGSDWTNGETTTAAQVAAVRTYILARDPAAAIASATDELRSGRDVAGRPAFSHIVSDLHAGLSTWDVFAVWRLDRAFRSTADAAPFFRELLRQGRGFISATENLDLSSPAGRAMLGMLQVFAEFERESGSQRTKLKMVSIASKGEWPVGNPPIGYRRQEKHNNILAIDPPAAARVLALFQDYASGSAGFQQLATRHGIRGKQTVAHLLRNRTYLGLICYAGQEYPARHPAIVSPELFAAVQARLPGSPAAPRPTRRQYPYILAGLVDCSCGRRMTTGCAHGRGRSYPYYRCTDHACGKMIRADRLDMAVMNVLSRTTIPQSLIQAAADQFAAERLSRQTRALPELDNARAALRTAEKQAAALKQAMLDGLIDKTTSAAWNRDYAEALGQVEHWKTRVADLAGTSCQAAPSGADLVAAAIESLSGLSARLRLAADSPDAVRQLILGAVTSVRNNETGWTVTLFGDQSRPVRLMSKLAPQIGPERTDLMPVQLLLAV